MSEQNILHTLNPQQSEAVQATEGAVLVLAGAGTGKTKVLTTRIAHILNQGLASPPQILAVTFTNKAAQEMKQRIATMLNVTGEDPRGPILPHSWWLGTFHALAARMLRQHANLVGLTSQFTIIDADDRIRLLKQLMEANHVDIKKLPPKAVMAVIDRFKDRALGPDEAAAQKGHDAKILSLYRLYQGRLKDMNACDFGDLLMHIIHILRKPENAAILEGYHQRFKYILVDEYQDTNTAQYLWLRLLAQRGEGQPSNICCVGDDDQSIYGWRGAELGNILKFESDFPNAKVIRLEQNYRSTNRILKAAGGLITANASRLGKTLWSEQGEGEKIIIRGLWDGGAEARWVGEQITRLSEDGISLDQVAILVRAGFQMREFEERFIQLGLPYQVYGGLRFYERAEIRDALAYFRVVAQPADDLALERIINTPKRGIGNATLQLLNQHARYRQIPLYRAVAELSETDELKPGIRKKLQALIGQFEDWRQCLIEGQNNKNSDGAHTDLAKRILDEAGYTQMWLDAKTPDAPGRVENLKELISAISEFSGLPDFLEHVSLVLDNADEAGHKSVTLMTLHAAKGLEFDAVFLPGWEDGLFPSQRSMDESGLKGLEEERRLAYVGLTRARRRAFISHVAQRHTYGNWISALPSRFIEELPEEHIDSSSDIRSSSGYHHSGGREFGRSAHWDSSGFQPSRSTPKESANNAGFRTGTRIRHAKFGDGSVIHVDGHKLDIKFDSGDHKRVIDSFVEIMESQ